MTNISDRWDLISLDQADLENLGGDSIFCSENGLIKCLYGFRPDNMKADTFCYYPSVGFGDKDKLDKRNFIELQHGALLWASDPTSGYRPDFIVNNLYADFPTGTDNYFGVFFDTNHELDAVATAKVFGFTYEELETIIKAYSKVLNISVYQEGRITFSKTRSNDCDLTGNTIPRNFPYITVKESSSVWSHISLFGFYSHLSLLMQNGKRSTFFQTMVKNGCSEEYLERTFNITSEVFGSQVVLRDF